MEQHNLQKWTKANEEQFKPPVCAKLMFGHPVGQLKIMFVGSPNERKDYHVEEGEELFYMVKGEMQLPIVHQSKPEIITIREGEMFLLPARVPHSPQRPNVGSLGLVIERDRDRQTEMDCLRYYIPDTTPTTETILWQHWFYCEELESLGNIVKKFKETEQSKTGKPIPDEPTTKPYFEDSQVFVAPPFAFEEWIKSHESDLETSEHGVVLFGTQTKAMVYGDNGGRAFQTPQNEHETFIWQYRGASKLTHGPNKESTSLSEGTMALIQPQHFCEVEPLKGSVILTVQQFKAA